MLDYRNGQMLPINERGVIKMGRASYEIWMHEKQRTWEVYTNLTDELRTELHCNGWAFVLRDGDIEDASEKETLKK